MPRPTLSEDILERLEAVAADRLDKVPIDHLDTTQRLAFVLDELEELADAADRADRLERRVEKLEAKLEEARSEAPAEQQPDATQFDLDLDTNTRNLGRGP
jgi:vacuolar-type H+-ATPase subunit I/STV1